MTDANPPVAGRDSSQKLVSELKVTAHLMSLDPGLFCILQSPSKAADAASGLPGVRISLPPTVNGNAEHVTIATFRPDGWLSGVGDAALVRVGGGPAQILVTVYQAPHVAGGAPNIQVMKLIDSTGQTIGQPGAQGVAQPVVGQAPAPPAAVPSRPSGGPARRTALEVVAHIQERGDVGGRLGEWMGERGSRRWIEGFGLAPTGQPIGPKDIEYQAVLGRGWLSPWVEGGQFCGSRGMALPILGLRVRLKGAAAETHELFYSATFVDGSSVGPVAEGEPCEAETLSAVEAFQVVISRRADIADVPDNESEDAAQVALEAAEAARKAGNRKASGPVKATKTR